nr:hypothetical protein [Tanacetum cinerariifolium]
MKVLCLFSDMQKDLRIRPNEVSFVALVNACGDLGTFSQGVWAHCYMIKNGLKVNRFVAMDLIYFYVNRGFLEFARRVFDEFPKKDVFCYNAMLRGFATHGERYEIEPKVKDHGCLVDLLGQAERVNESIKVLQTMPRRLLKDYGIDKVPGTSVLKLVDAFLELSGDI